MANEAKTTDSLKTATSALSEQTKKLEISSYYTHGDFERAKQMVAGTYRDVYVIKGKFSSSSVYGAFLVFFNGVWGSLMHVLPIVSHSFDVGDVKTNVDWKVFEKDLANILAKREHDDVLTAHVREELTNGFTLQFGGDLKRLLESNDEITLNHVFQKLVQSRMGFQNIKCSVDFEQSSSLDMELYSTSSRKINLDEYRKKLREEEAAKDGEKAPGDDASGVIGNKDVRLLLKGSLILSPIKGKDIGQIIVGDRVKVKIVDSNPKAQDVLKAFNAISEDGVLPITGRVVNIKKKLEGGYQIYTIVAKGIFILIDEDEENIKIALDESSQKQAEAQPAGSAISLPLIIILILAFFGILGFVLSFFLM